MLATLSGCGLFSSDKGTSSQVATIHTLSAPNFDKSALIIINTNLDTANSDESIGNIPSSFALLKRVITTPLMPAPCLHINFNKIYSHTIQQQIRPQAVESLTANDTTASFKTYDFEHESLSKPLTINATLQYAGTKCLIYVETGISTLFIKNANGSETAQAINWSTIGKIFDEKIYTNETPIFGTPEDVDENQKVIILYYKFNRGTLNENKDTGFIAGYFFPYDITPKAGVFSNKKDMLFINVTCRTVSQNIETLAHEFKHLCNYSERVVNRHLPELDTWISEGLAECGAHIGLDTPLYDQIERVKIDSYIRNGQIPLIEWSSTAQQYALTYTFFQYVKNQSQRGNTILSEISVHPYSDYRSIENLLSAENSSFTNFTDILSGFHIANVLNQPTGPYGYNNDPTFSDFNELSAPSISNISLYSGGAVYFYPSSDTLKSFTPKNFGKSIVFYKINP